MHEEMNADMNAGTPILDEANGTPEGTGNKDVAEQRLTFADLLKDREYQADFDRRVAKALDTARAKWEAEATERIHRERTEAERMAKMTAEQKADHERQTREKALAEREAAITLREMRAQALEVLSERSLPKELSDVLNYENAETLTASIDAAERTYRAAVQAGVEERLKGKPPQTGGAVDVPWSKMTLSERGVLYRDNPEKARQLAKASGFELE